MNIVVLSPSGKTFVRPDTTWERANEDFYVPEFISRISASRVLYVRVCKPGRSVGEKFAERYYDSFGYGALLYPEDLIDGSPEGFACASCLDHSSFLSGELSPKEELDPGLRVRVCRAIAEVTRFCYIRIGDLIAIETSPREALCSREDGSFHYTEGSCDFKIIF